MIEIGRAKLKNRFMNASGCFGYGVEFDKLMNLEKLGAIVVKGVASTPWQGNPGVRIAETPAGMLNSIGLENPGVDYFLEQYLPFLQKKELPIIVNVVGRTIEEYQEVVKKLTDSGVTGFEINISCPNVKAGGISMGTSPKTAYEVVKAVRVETDLPLWVKLSPNVTDIVEIAVSVEEAGADALTLINSVTGMAIDIKTKKPILGNITGGLSGPAIKPIALRMVYQVAGRVSIPVIGVGGITCLEDALEFFMAGASAVQVGSGLFREPSLLERLPDEFEAYLKQEGLTAEELVGIARRNANA